MTHARTGRLPDFVIIGAAKSGTTSANHYLELHPDIFMDRPKETKFFMDPPVGNWNRGVEWYRSRFASAHAICGDATPGYTAGPAAGPVAERMAAVIPGAKLIYILREPVSRLRSDYLMRLRMGRLPPGTSFSGFIESSNAWQPQAQYGTRLAEFYAFYPKNQVLVLESSKLYSHRNETVREMYRFVGVDEHFSSPLFDKQLNTRKFQSYPNKLGRRILSSKTYEQLASNLPSRTKYYGELLLRKLFQGRHQPDLTLTPDAAHRIREVLDRDIQLLRQLSGLPLRGLDPVL